MSAETLISIAVSIAVLIYLIYTMLRPEKF